MPRPKVSMNSNINKLKYKPAVGYIKDTLSLLGSIV